MAERLAQQIAFIVEADKAKQVIRRNYLCDGSRRENVGEHSWHIALMAVTLREWSRHPEIDLMRVLRMLLVHDLVEIDAGDTFHYDAAGQEGKVERERQAAERIFSLLPGDQAADYRAHWEEFEARATPEARYAAALDRLAPLLLNLRAGGKLYREAGVGAERILERVRTIEDGSAELWDLVQELVGQADAEGLLRTEAPARL